MSLNSNAVSVMTSLTDVAGKLAQIMQDPKIAAALQAAIAGKDGAAACGATLEAQALNQVATTLQSLQDSLPQLYGMLKSRSDVFEEINNIT